MRNDTKWKYIFMFLEKKSSMTRVNTLLHSNGMMHWSVIFIRIALTHWWQNKLASILETLFSNKFLVWKWLYFDSNLNWMHNELSSSFAWDKGLVLNSWQNIIWTNGGLIGVWCPFDAKWSHEPMMAWWVALLEINFPKSGFIFPINAFEYIICP